VAATLFNAIDFEGNMKIKDYLSMLRMEQWYKNLVVFLAILFSENLFNAPMLEMTVLAFFALCLTSSANYIINDIADRKSDASNHEKKNRSIAAGKISLVYGLIIAGILLLAAILIANSISRYFVYAILFLFFFTQLYSFFLKKEAIADILCIGINFVTRAVAGALAINVWISPWLILGPFFLSIFLSTGKRYSELMYHGKNAVAQRKALQMYSLELMNALLLMSTACLIISYSLYCFLSQQKYLLISLPFAMYAVFRYFQLVYSGSEVARMPQKIFKDARILLAMFLWLISVLGAVYLIKAF